MKKRYFVIIFITLFALIFWLLMKDAGSPTFVEKTPEVFVPEVQPAQKDDMIIVESPLPGSQVKSPLVIRGKARGSWYFEASFPVYLTDWDGKIIAEGHATAQGDWMTTEYVPFTASLTYVTPPGFNKTGFLVLKKDNPSGESKFDNALEIKVSL